MFPGRMFGGMQRMSGLPEVAVREIEQIHAKWLQFETAGDVRSLMALCADDIELWPPDAKPLIGREAVSASVARGITRHGAPWAFHKAVHGDFYVSDYAYYQELTGS